MAPVTSVAEVRAVVAVLLQSNKIRNATHNIMAYRIQVCVQAVMHAALRTAPNWGCGGLPGQVGT